MSESQRKMQGLVSRVNRVGKRVEYYLQYSSSAK